MARLDADRLERFNAFDQRKYRGLLSTWLGELDVFVFQCSICGHAWYGMQPSVEYLMQMYATARPFNGDVGDVSREPAAQMSAEMARLRRALPRQVPKPTLLDYGSGRGRWARAAVGAGFAVTAFEPSHVRAADDNAPFELVSQSVELAGRRFDAVQLEQVLEHITDPLQTMQSVHALCHDQTLIRLTVPNIRRAPEGAALWTSWPFDGRAPHTLAPFEHLHGFTPRSLRTLSERAGFRPVTDARVWRTYPVKQLRRLLGRAFDFIDTTSVILRPVLP